MDQSGSTVEPMGLECVPISVAVGEQGKTVLQMLACNLKHHHPLKTGE